MTHKPCLLRVVKKESPDHTISNLKAYAEVHMEIQRFYLKLQMLVSLRVVYS